MLKEHLNIAQLWGGSLILFFEDIDQAKTQTGKVDENEYKSIGFEILYGHLNEAKKIVSSIINRVTLENFKDTYYFYSSCF